MNLDDQIRSCYNLNNADPIILDGVINENSYRSCKVKMLWLLWEPYNDGGWENWNWDSRKWINSEPALFTHPTWRKISNLTKKVFKEISFETMREPKCDLELLRYISYLNVMKHPGEHTSKNVHPHLKQSYKKYSDILHEQIRNINPNVIIGGNTLYLFLNYFDLDYKNGVLIPGLSRYFWQTDKTLYIDSHHPRALSNENVTNISNLIAEWSKGTANNKASSGLQDQR